ncbi:glycosyltransferase family 2 protein, partial [Rhizobium leguminosarum]
MERPVLSVLINNYNYARFVGRAIDSALNQDARNIEIIVVDDGSTDQSRSVLEAYDSRVK